MVFVVVVVCEIVGDCFLFNFYYVVFDGMGGLCLLFLLVWVYVGEFDEVGGFLIEEVCNFKGVVGFCDLFDVLICVCGLVKLVIDWKWIIWVVLDGGLFDGLCFVFVLFIIESDEMVIVVVC